MKTKKQQTIEMPLYISFYPENGYVITNFNKRIIINNENKKLWIPLFNEVARGTKIKINCILTARDCTMAKYSLKKLGLLENGADTNGNNK